MRGLSWKERHFPKMERCIIDVFNKARVIQARMERDPSPEGMREGIKEIEDMTHQVIYDCDLS